MRPTRNHTGFTLYPASQPGRAQGRGKLLKGLNGYPVHTLPQQIGEILVNMSVYPSGFVRKGTEVSNELRVLPQELGKEMLPNADALEAEISIGRVVDEGKALSFRVGAHRRARAIDEWTDDPVRALGFDARKPADASTAQQPPKNALGLILLRMPDGDAIGSHLSRDIEKRGVPKLTCAPL